VARSDDRTEKPTAKRLNEARRKGQVAKSQDLSGAVALGAGVVALCLMGSQVVDGAAGAMRSIFAQIERPGAATTAAGLNGLEHLVLQTMLGTVAPIAGICLVGGLLANVAQVGVRPAFARIKPDIKRLNPVTGFKSKFGPQVLFETGKSLAKVVAVGAAVALALVPQITHLAAAVGTPPAALGQLLSSGVKSIAERAVAVYLLIAIADFIWQKRRVGKSLKMTKHEVKEEGKQTQLPAEVRGALRRRQLQAARARMMAAVPQADVVVTNPTHFAVALSYDGSKPAPVVTAKGQDLVALQIKRIADEHDVPVVRDPPLARSLHKSVELDQMIPTELYAAVAQVLAFVYRMAARRKVAV